MAIPTERFDVVICGGGVAGLTLALQLRKRLPDHSILVLEKQVAPLPEGTHKVGESTNEGGTHWLRELAGLKGYVETTHIKKLGLRFFGSGCRKEGFDRRFEIGDVIFARNSSYQFDRGVLENDLRRFAREAGAVVEEGVSVNDIDLGKPDHSVTFAYLKDNATVTVTGRWVIDAMGRRRFLQSKLGTAKRSEHSASACWWRIRGDFDVGGMVSPENTDWHERVFARRWYSTNHLFGPGYWAWVIPLCSNMTSVGIVADETIHPIRDRNTFEKSLHWLAEQEPHLFELIKDEKPLDFLVLKNFAHKTTQAFSSEHWCCVGEAASFTDPLYSMGSDLIAIANRTTTRLIELEALNALTAETVELYNKVYLKVLDTMTELFRDMYPAFAADNITMLKVMWDVACYWGFFSQLVIQDFLYRDETLPELLELASRLETVNLRVQDAFRTAAANWDNSAKTGFYNFGGVSKVTDLRAVVTDKRGIPEVASNISFLEQLGSAFCRFVSRDGAKCAGSNDTDASGELERLLESLATYMTSDGNLRVPVVRRAVV